jgi:hypothetical protein
MHRRLTALAALLVPALAAAGNEKDGARLFKDQCAHCHAARPLDRQGPAPLRRDKGPDLVQRYHDVPERFDTWVQQPTTRGAGSYCKARPMPREDLDSLQRFLFNVSLPIPPDRTTRRLREIQLHLERQSGGTGYTKPEGNP